MTIDEILKEWPELEREDIYQALGYTSLTMEERIVPMAAGFNRAGGMGHTLNGKS